MTAVTKDSHDIRVLLISMPFVSIERPSIGLSLLKAQLRRKGIHCDMRYLTFTLASIIGKEDYIWISERLPYTAFAGEWLFSKFLFGNRQESDMSYINEVLINTWKMSFEDIKRLLGIRMKCGHFIDFCAESLTWSDYAVIGFTSTFSQNLSSLALAERIKKLVPDIKIVFGGANWEGEMGIRLHQAFTFVDYVCQGEADESFPELVEKINIKDFEAGVIPGVISRQNGTSVIGPPATVITDLDTLPFPDYDDFFRDFSECPFVSDLVPNLLFETSRGCWWGARKPCTFCGLNGCSVTFRSKNSGRVLSEIKHLQGKYGGYALEAVDNILDMNYFNTLLPRIAEEQLDVNIFFEVKANLTRSQVRLLAESGILSIQPGIESLNDHILRLMNKGVTALQNLQLLKWCKEFGVKPEWNLLYGFPGEHAEDYEEILSLLDAIWFLDPPRSYGPVRLDRFSSYFNNPSKYGINNLMPLKPYFYIYPFDQSALSKIAYYFDYRIDENLVTPEASIKVIHEVENWRKDTCPGMLKIAFEGSGGTVLTDTRSTMPFRQVRLKSWRSEIYQKCDSIADLRTLINIGRQNGGEIEEIKTFLSLCVKLGLMVKKEEKYLALAVYEPPLKRFR